MKILRYKEDIIPVCYVLMISVIDFYAWKFLDHLQALLVAIVSLLFFKQSVIAYYHHVSHHPIFFSKRFEYAFHQLCCMSTLQPPYAWVSYHNIGHHKDNVHMDQEKDLFAWKVNGNRLSHIEYSLYHTLKAYPHAFIGCKDKPTLRKKIIAGIAIHILLLCLLAYFDPINTFIVYFVPQIICFWGTMYASYWHHVDLEPKNVYESCRNNLNRWYNLTTWNLGYHTAHHFSQGTHWSKLPELHKQIEHLIPKELVTTKPTSKFWSV